MTAPVASTADFRALAARRFDFLVARGFARSPAAELDTPVGASVVFAGRHVGFVIGMDTRDRTVEVRVTRARNGALAETGPGGYTANLLQHLVTHAGYRGRGPRAAGEPPVDRVSLERVLGAWAEFVLAEGAPLLADDASALPGPA